MGYDFRLPKALRSRNEFRSLLWSFSQFCAIFLNHANIISSFLFLTIILCAHFIFMWMVERMPVIVHTIPFVNIATGNSSIMADKLALHNWPARTASLSPRPASGPTSTWQRRRQPVCFVGPCGILITLFCWLLLFFVDCCMLCSSLWIVAWSSNSK